MAQRHLLKRRLGLLVARRWLAEESGPKRFEVGRRTAERMRDVFRERRSHIVDGLNAIEGIRCLTPGGAFYVWPNVTEACRRVGAANSEELRTRLLNEAGVAVLADIHFGTQVQGDGEHVRFSYASSFEAIDEGLERIDDFLRKNSK